MSGTPSWMAHVTNKYIERLSSLLLQPGSSSDPREFFTICVFLSRCIDYALSNGQILDKARDLPTLMKQIFQQKNDDLSQAAAMVLMISVKSACKIGWFQRKDSEELLTIADKMGKIYCSIGNVSAGPSSCHSIIPTIMERFYPKMKLGQILVSIEAKPGYGAATVDFNVTNRVNQKDKIWLLVAQTDNIATSSCLISPQLVNFLINGKGVGYRTGVHMDTGPQMPTDVTGMLKYGSNYSNLLQAVGQFSGHYVIIVACMSVTSLLEHPTLQDYLQPAATSVDSDSDIFEGPSQISLICPISYTRIKTPVKGHSCRHFRCFDYDNFIDINSRRPNWRCPLCNQCVSYADIRLDRNMVEVLKGVDENVVKVIVHADGSWKAVLENNVDKLQNKAHNCEKEQIEPQESTCFPSTVTDVMDLTNDDVQMQIMDIFETPDRKPVQASVHGQFSTPKSTSLGMMPVGVNQNVAAQIEGDFSSGLQTASGGSDTAIAGGSEHHTLLDTDSPAFRQETEGHDNNSVIHNQFSTPNNSQLPLNYNLVVNEYGRSSSAPRHISRTPIAVQALPVQSQALRPQRNSRTNLKSLPLSSSPATPPISLSNPTTADGLSAILSDTERQQYFSRSSMNVPQVSGIHLSALQHLSATQNQVPPVNMSAPGQFQNPYRASGLLSEHRSSHLQQALNPRAPDSIRPSNAQRSHILQGGSQAGIFEAASQVVGQSSSISVQNQTAVASTSFTANGLQRLTGGQRGNVGGPPQSVSRPGDLFNLQSEQNWSGPTPRMRGSLAGRELSDDIRHQIITPTQPVQSSRPQVSPSVHPTQTVQSSRPQVSPPILPAQRVQSSRLQVSPTVLPTQPVQISRPQGPQPVQSSRPQGLQAIQPTQPVQISRPQGSQPVHPVQISRPQGSQPLRPTQAVQISRPQGPQPVQISRPQGSQPVQPVKISRPQDSQPVLPTQSVQISRPQGLQPVLPAQQVQSSSSQGPQPVQNSRPQLVQPTQSVQISGSQGMLPVQPVQPPVRPTVVLPQQDVHIANNRNAHNHSSNT
ncbi:hypothetical protein RIF29_37470 [Crotalaria pallida]|uniref:SP-RING-type domain-containing protein n=1 Tax=Crotalaria pallida TaxID=3830 RepID=A0AAN9ECC7_CROPI